MTPPSSTAALLQDLIAQAKKAGADAADAMLVDAASLAVGYRLGKVETLERSESGDLGLRVFVGRRQAMVSSTDRRAATLDEMASRAVAMARLAPEDEFCGLAAPSDIARSFPALELADAIEPSAEQLIAAAKQAEDAARAVTGVTNSEGAEAGQSLATVTVAASNGFIGSYRRSGYNLSASVLAGEGTGMVRDYDHASRVFLADMPAPESIGRKAGERAVRRIGARKMPTARMPVVFDKRIAGSLVGAFTGAISGAAVARGTSFLKDAMGQKLFPDAVAIVDDPFRARGLRSRPFDAEGLLPQKRNLVDRGVLTSWLLDLRSARQLGLRSTGHAARAPGGAPSPSASNLYLEAGKQSPADLIRDIKQGFYVTELMGMGVNGVTGDYSHAAAGFWIENGAIVFPVNEMTIAGNLKDMYRNLAAADDLEFLRGIDSPTLRIEGMTVAGV
jgi:PmbA protein